MCARCACIDTAQAQHMSAQWNMEMSCALVQHVNSICQHLAISINRLHPHEVYIEEAQLCDTAYSCLQGKDLLFFSFFHQGKKELDCVA